MLLRAIACSDPSRWAYKGMLLPEEPDGLETQWQEKGRSQGIAPFLNESFKKWKSLTIVAACMMIIYFGFGIRSRSNF